jgi:murein DD-endopeptidase MepM/ murein hydrolase activator NlpD
VRAVAFYKPIPNLKMPLPGGKEWIVNTQIGEVLSSKSHSGSNHYSIDFGFRSKSGGIVYTESSVRVYSAGSGVVLRCGLDQYNGYNVTVDHDGDGDINTGIQTRYLHLATDPTSPGPIGPSLYVGKKVNQGSYLGIMGNTGTEIRHLHFGVQYHGDGSLSNEILGIIRLDGRLLKDYTVGNYYLSTNVR